MMKKNIHTWVSCLVVILAAIPLQGLSQDQGVGEMMFTAGTVATDTGGQDWAWLQWMATDSELLKDRPMDIYLKAGDAASANLFSFQGRVQQVTDPRVIELLLARGEALGENLTNLEGAIDSLYAGAEPAESLSLAEKISALISGSQNDADLYQNLVFMGRAHPAISMAIGHGFAGRIPSSGFSTFEVRDHSNDEVIGRVTVEAGSPEILPAPGPISRVPDVSPKGNLNIRLRWDVPDALKRVSLMQFGYNLHRVTKYSAEKWWGTPPEPTTAELLSAVDQYEDAKKVNRMPILVDAATATSNTWFIVDDNDGLSEGGTPFLDGADYYYFVSALDLLGRDGELSEGYLTFPCDRMAPSVPHGVRTRTISDYDGGVRLQWVEVSWAHDTNDTDTARYYVYRHTGMADMQSNAVYALTNRISGAIVPSPSDTRMTYEDHSLTSNDWGITYWYTVRAEDEARCTNNLSGNSAPAYGLIRDWIGPGAATGTVLNIYVQNLTCSYDRPTTNDLPGRNNVELSCTRPSADDPIDWVEFALDTSDNLLARLYFSPSSTRVAKQLFFDSERQGSEVRVYCRVGTSSGKISNWASASTKAPDVDPPSADIGFQFKGESSFMTVPTEGGPDGPGPHVWRGNGTTITPIRGEIPPQDGAKTARIYRRIDGGRRTLIEQGDFGTNEVESIVFEDVGTANGGRICYYYQLFDEHGNAGPMVLWACFETEPRVDLPTPILEKIDSTGTATVSPGMALNWFCTTPGVERFELALGVKDGDLPATFGAQGYELQADRTNEMDFVVGGVTNTLNVGFYRTGRIGTTFGTADYPLFSLKNSADLDRDYVFMVRAIGTVGTEGEWSNAEEFHWYTVPLEGPNVPWPTRDTPDVQSATFNTNLTAHPLDGSWEGYFYTPAVGIRIGEIPNDEFSIDADDKSRVVEVFAQYKPMDYLYANEAEPNQNVMSCVLYRYQITNSLYLTVSGDVVQVSPMMEKIAYGYDGSKTTIYDPFIAMCRQDPSDPWGLFLIDTQPVIRGASYQYLIMRFDAETKELDKIIPAGTITIP